MNRVVPLFIKNSSQRAAVRMDRDALANHQRSVLIRMAIRFMDYQRQQERERALRVARVAWFYSRVEPGGA